MRRRRRSWCRPSPQIPGCHAIAATKGLPIGLAHVRRDIAWHVVWIAVFVAIVHIRTAAVAVILPRSLHSVMESAALDLVELLRRDLPAVLLSIGPRICSRRQSV
jgi:hypothetical protein